MKKALIFSCFILCLLMGAGSSNATPLIENGGFENGLAGWSSSNVEILDNHASVTAYEGSYMAVLSASQNQGLGTGDASLSQVFNIGEYASQQLRLSFAYNLQGLDKASGDFGLTDTLTATISAGGGSTVLLSEIINDSTGDYDDYTVPTVLGWKTFSAFLPVLADSTSEITLSFYFENTSFDGGLGDWRQDASAYIDAVSVRSVPDASIMFLLGPGLVGLGLLGRRKFIK